MAPARESDRPYRCDTRASDTNYLALFFWFRFSFGSNRDRSLALPGEPINQQPHGWARSPLQYELGLIN